MTWEEYKAMKNKDATATIEKNEVRTSKNSIDGMSWQEYKQKREEQRRIEEEQRKREEEQRKIEAQKQEQKRQEIINKQTSQKTDNVINNINKGQSFTELQKAYGNLSMTEQAALAKKLQEETKMRQSQPVTPMYNKETIEKQTGTKLADAKYAQDYSNSIFQPSAAFKDGYQVGDITKTAVSTVGDATARLVGGIANIGEGMGKSYTYTKAKILDKIGQKEKAQALRENAKGTSSAKQDIDRFTRKIGAYSVLGGKSKNLAESLGYIAGIAAISSVGGEAAGALGGTETAATVGATLSSSAATFSSSMGHGITEAYNEGANDDDAYTYGIIAGTAETATELMFGGIGKGSKAIGLSKSGIGVDDALAKKVGSIFKNQLAKNFAEYSIKASGEGVEEVVSGIIQAVGKKVTYMSEAELSQLLQDQHLLEQFVDGAVISAISSAPGLVTTTMTGQDYIQDETPMINQIQELQKAQEALPTARQVQQLPKTTEEAPRAGQAIENTEVAPAATQENTYSNKLKQLATEEINKSNISSQDKTEMLNVLNGLDTVTDADIEAIRNTIQGIRESQQLETKGDYKNDQTRRQKYMQYKNDTSTYDSTAVDEVLDAIPQNRNGRRTVKQWLQAADEIGKRIANLSNEEIEKIAYKSWFDIQPSKSITQYDNVAHKPVNFQKFTFDEWINTINKAVNEARANNEVQSIQENTTKTNNIDKQKQLDIIQKSNPMTDDYHTGIRNIDDIKTFEEAMQDDESFVYGDFSKEDAEKALKEGKVTVYSSNPIEQGSFVSTSQNMAKDYAGNGKIYSQEVDLKDVAWINGDEGQYAKVENNQETLYNNNERESGINGKLERNIDERRSRVYEESSQKQRKFTWDEYNKWEQSIKSIEERNLTDSERQSINKAKQEYNKTVYLFDENNNDNTYSGGASKLNPNTIKISRQQAEYFGLDNMIEHENIESDIMHNDKANDILSPVIDLIKNDPAFNKQKTEFWKDQDGEMPKDDLIAKDVLCDRFAEIKNKTKMKYDNVLSNATNSSIDLALSNYYKQVYDKELDTTSSFNLQEKSIYNTAPTADNKLATSEYTKQQEEKGKFRKHYDSIIKSQYTTEEAKAISKELMGSDTYIPETNNEQLKTADERIRSAGAESELNSLMSRAMTGGNIKSVDIAVGERLIQYYSRIGDKAKLQEAIQATAMAGTSAGQTVQAMSLLNHQTPEGQAIWLQRSVDKMNNDLKRRRGEKAEQFNLTPEMTEKIVNSQNAEELHNNLDEVYKQLGQQVTKSTIQKVDSWRYFSMLANPRTHIRNIVGNVVMGKVQGAKNKVAGAIEGVVSKINPNMERTHTIKSASKEVKEFAKNDISNVADRLELNENKYNPKTRLENSMRTFKHDSLENTIGKLFEINNKALEVEDGWGLKAGYVKALSEYMTANKLNPNTITDAELAKARNYAIEQAKEATFHQASALATALNQFSNKNKVTKFLTDATIPFKKTPINVAKAGIEYSPVGLAKSAIYDTVQLRKGNITVNQYIDNISKGLTGTAITLLGYALANAGVLKADGNDDDKEKFEKERGKQKYSIQIGNSTYSLDWLAPAGIPLFVGAKTQELMQQNREKKTSSSDDESAYSKAIEAATSILDAFTNAVDPMTEMSMLSGLSSTLKSYDDNLFAGMATNMSKSYVNQFIPTALGQIAKTTDKYERDTTSTKTGTLPKAIDTTKNQIMSKIPGLRQQLPTKTNIWGEKLEQNKNILLRGLESATFPWSRKDIRNNNVDKELINLYEETGEKDVLPGSVNKNITIDKQKYVFTSEEYSKYKQLYGDTSYKILNNMVSSNSYKNLDDDQKQKAIDAVYDYAKEQIKIDYAKQNKLNYEVSDSSKTVEAIQKAGGNVSNYFEFVGLSQGISRDADKINTLSNMNYPLNTKKAIYENTLGKKDSTYKIAKTSDININEYLKYKAQDFSADKIDNGTINGKTISGSKKQKVYNYIDNMRITYTQKLLLKGTEYTLSDSEQEQIANYINSLNITKNEKIEMFSKFQGFTVYKNGSIKY